MLEYYNINRSFLRSFSLTHWFVSLIKALSVFEHNFFILKLIVSFFFLILSLPNIASSEGLFSYGTIFPNMPGSWSVSSSISSSALALPALIVLSTLANLLE